MAVDIGGSKSARMRDLTSNDAKVLGQNTQRKRQKSGPDTKFPNSSFKNLNSCWTPIVNRASNEQIFLERCELISHWFDMWTDSQRKRFFRMLLHKSEESQLHFVRDWFEERVPLRKLDFTRVLPRFLSLYIFSFLDPRSLSRASMVSWNWKVLTEQDVLWTPKCQKYGWFLPYSPSENEYGAWKRHYIACTLTLDLVLPTTDERELFRGGNEIYGTRGDGSRQQANAKKMKHNSVTKLTAEQSKAIRDARDPWIPPEAFPPDVERGNRAYFLGLNPNDPVEPPSARLFHNKYGQIDKTKTAALMASMSSFGIESKGRQAIHPLQAAAKEEEEMKRNSRHGLSKSMEIIKFEEERYNSIVDMPWEPPRQEVVSARPNLSGGSGTRYPIPWSKLSPPLEFAKMAGLMAGFPGYTHPRIIFISSRVPAHELLVDAVMFGVIPIVYEFEGTSLETLLFRLDQLLRGRKSQSIGFFGHKESNSELRLVHGRTLDLASLDYPTVRGFIERLAEHTVPVDQNGHIDLFSPLCADAAGTELLIQLEILTGMKFSAPTGLLGNYNHVSSEWSLKSEGVHPPTLYFEQNKLSVWAAAADLVQEAVKVTRQSIAKYLDRVHVDLSRQITGQIIFDALGQTDVLGVRRLSDGILEGILKLADSSSMDPLETLGFHLLERSELGVPVELDKLRTTSLRRSQISMPRSTEKADESDIEEELYEEDEDDRVRISRRSPPEKASTDAIAAEKDERSMPSALQTRRMSLMGGDGSRGPLHLTPEILAEHPDKRTPVAQEILACEVDFLRSMEIARDWYMTPLRRALQSNKAILAAHHVQTLFGDLLQLLEISRALVFDLRGRIRKWGSNQCIGDVLLKYCGRLKAYTNFLSNYPVILRTLQRSVETQPKFRAFLARHDNQPESKMLCLQDFYLLPPRHATDLCTLVAWFESHTPLDHPDRGDLKIAIGALRRLGDQVAEHQLKAERDREILRVQKLILACPQLLEGNRYFILHEDAALLRPPSQDSIDPEFRIYQHIEDCGIFVFNDAVVFTRRTTKHFPFERVKEHSYRFQVSVDMHRISVQDIADSKYIRNALRLTTSKRSWYLGCDSAAAKHRLVSSLNTAILGAIDNLS